MQTKNIKIYFLSAILIVLISVVYAKTVNFNIVNHDDYRLIVKLDNQYKSDGIIKKIFTSNVFLDNSIAFYRPVLTLSFYFNNLFSRSTETFGTYHFTNILIHTLFTLLLFSFLRKYCFETVMSFIAAAIFAVHFIAVDSVAWISGRNDSLLSLFVLASFFFFIRYHAKEGNSAFNAAAHIVLFAAALFTKESGILVPVMCVIYSFMKHYPQKKALYAGWAAVTALFFILRYNTFHYWDFWLLLSDTNLLKKNIYMLCDYISASFGLSKIELYPVEKISVYIKGFSVFFFLLTGSVFSTNRKYALFYLFSALAFLLPNFFIDRTFFQGNRMYLPLALTITCVFYVLTGFINIKKYKLTVYIACFLLILLLGFKSYNRVNIYKDEKAYFAELKKSSPQKTLQYIAMWAEYSIYDKAVYHMESIMNQEENKDYVLFYTDLYLRAGEFAKAADMMENKSGYFIKNEQYYIALIYSLEQTGAAEKASGYKQVLNEMLSEED